MTAQVIDMRTRRPPAPLIRTALPHLVAATTWWTCPAWCARGDSCYGGETFNFGGGTTTVPRIHHGSVYAETVYDIDGAGVDVLVEVTAVEDPDEGFVEAPAVMVNVDGLKTDAGSAERIASAILAAVAAARQPLPTIPRSPSAPVGGGWASTSGRGHSPGGSGRAHPPMEAS